MGPKKNYSERIEKVITQLSESVLALSDDDFLAEVTAAGRHPEPEAKRVRNVLQKSLQALDNTNLCLSNLGHAINPSNWQCGPLAYHNTCLHCGLSVSITIASGEIRGSAVQKACRATVTMGRTGTV